MCCHLFVCACVFKTCHVFHVLYVTSQLPLSHMHMIMVWYSDLFLSGSAWQLWFSRRATSPMHSLMTGNHGSKKPSDCADTGDSALACSSASPRMPSLLWLADSSITFCTHHLDAHTQRLFYTHTQKQPDSLFSVMHESEITHCKGTVCSKKNQILMLFQTHMTWKTANTAFWMCHATVSQTTKAWGDQKRDHVMRVSK